MTKILIGLAVLLIGLHIFTGGLKDHFAGGTLHAIDNIWAMAGISLGGTLLWQSSSITTVLLVGVVSGGLIGLEAGIAGIIGANLGTTITAALASVASMGQNLDGVRLAISHFIFNGVGALIMFPFIPWIAKLIRFFV